MKGLLGSKKILLYLLNKANDFEVEEGIYPFSFCQEGIAQNVELSQNRVSKLLVDMEKDELINKESASSRNNKSLDSYRLSRFPNSQIDIV